MPPNFNSSPIAFVMKNRGKSLKRTDNANFAEELYPWPVNAIAITEFLLSTYRMYYICWKQQLSMHRQQAEHELPAALYLL